MNPLNRQKTVLVIEDSPDDAAILQMAARKICPEVCFVFAEGAAEAMDYLKRAEQRAEGPLRPDVVLVDIGLRAMDGFSVVEQLRELRQLEGLKILMWSGGIGPDLLARAMKAGADLLLQKAVSYDDLAAEVKRICDIAREVP
ncbi:MAG TPA: response regulator [Verrucomicrobiae bacterium]|nr:response regulator [Verrucomicrobiae bacterium]